MLHFGFTTMIDFLSWTVILALGLKIVATVIVLLVDKDARDRPGWGSILWWTTKVTPVIAAPCLIWIAILEREDELVKLFLALTVFVLIAVPLAIRKRRRRMAESQLSGLEIGKLPAA